MSAQALSDMKDSFALLNLAIKKIADKVAGVASVNLTSIHNAFFRNQTAEIIISDHNQFSTYTVAVDAGSVTINREKITVTMPNVAGVVKLTVTKDGKPFEFEITVSSTGVIRPTAVSPSNGLTEQRRSVTLTATAFEWGGLADTHASSDWQVSTTPDFSTTVANVVASTTAKTSYTVKNLNTSTTYYWRVRYTGAVNGTSEWSDTVSFSTKASFAEAYGVTWNSTSDTYVRTGLATGHLNNTSYAGEVHTKLRRCVLDQFGEVKYYLSPTASTKKEDGTTAIIDGTDGNVMVEIPKFYFRYTHSAGVHTWQVSPIPETGFVVHPAFIRAGVEVDVRYIAAYEAFNLGGKLISGSGRLPTASITRTLARDMVRVNGPRWCLMDIDILFATQVLFLTEYATFDTQSILGNGNETGNDFSITTGSTNSIGNASSPATYDNRGMSYRGIENWYGSMWKWIDGVSVRYGTFYKSNDPAQFTDDVHNTNSYATMSMVGVTGAGYISNWDDGGKAFIANAVAGSSTTYVTDQHSLIYQVDHIAPLHGGAANSGLGAGGFTSFCEYGAGFSGTNVGARIAF